MEMAKPLAGIHVALLSGFADDGGFDAGRQAALTRSALAQRVDGLYVGGSTGESASMTPDELAEQQEVVAQAASGSGKVLIAHVGVPSLRETLRLARSAKALGYHGLSALPPHALGVRPDDIHDYYRALAEATDLPLIVYEIPVRTGRNTPLPEMDKLLSLPNVVGLKFTTPDIYALSRIQARHPAITYFYGVDEMFAAGAALGADGGIGSTYNIIGGLYTDIAAAVARTDLVEMRRLQRLSQDLVQKVVAVGVIPGVKHLLTLSGIDAGPARAPLRCAGGADLDALEAWFAEGHIDPWVPRPAG
jgi:N-acetylneuraminate lyase